MHADRIDLTNIAEFFQFLAEEPDRFLVIASGFTQYFIVISDLVTEGMNSFDYPGVKGEWIPEIIR